MKTHSLLLFLLGTLLLTSGCSSVTSTHPLSNPPVPIDQEKFEGVWGMEGGVLQVKFTENGIARIAGLEWRENQFQINHAEAIVTQAKEHNFLSVRYLDEKGTWEGYFFLAYKFSEQGDLILWSPNSKQFAKLVENKKLEGRVKEGDVTITDSPQRLLAFIDDPDNMELFDYRDPLVLRKITE